MSKTNSSSDPSSRKYKTNNQEINRGIEIKIIPLLSLKPKWRIRGKINTHESIQQQKVDIHKCLLINLFTVNHKLRF